LSSWYESSIGVKIDSRPGFGEQGYYTKKELESGKKKAEKVRKWLESGRIKPSELGSNGFILCVA
jgi:hypothetical protein